MKEKDRLLGIPAWVVNTMNRSALAFRVIVGMTIIAHKLASEFLPVIT